MLNENIFSDMERDVIGEVMNISLGSSATSLSSLLGKRVEITVPKVNVLNASEFSYENLEPAIGVEINYVEGLNGVNLMIWKRMDAKTIIEILLGQSIPDEEFVMDEINTSAICEVMNQMMGSAATALSDFLGKAINISTPIAYEIDDKTEFKNKYFTDEDVIVAVAFELFIEGSVESQFINVIPVALAREIVSSFLKGTETTEDPESGKEKESIPASNDAPNDDTEDEEYDEIDDEDEEEYIENVQPVKKNISKKAKTKKKQHAPVSVRRMEYDEFDDEEDILTEEQRSNLELIMSVPLEISVEIGKSTRTIKDILQFGQGTIVELDKQAGALVDIIVNGQLIAKGEVVVVNDNFGVRIVEIIKKEEIIKLTL
ncbi:flagellar motor switch phosphatase FliY [Sedimentibacter hydroxybenzoicus DSM 7310]|uniref:Flagellar motor switch phosphatase FliY n=1 Tax=Sedimentibacter hydroxybenzoicus DSM 7310 TaxID=1123245 RepID=A0A974BGE1_SEDHY|nr:flagellar motor switch phosphatase FliY [Sedimentibacter hydroxybenzoicus]NYB72603.1 flagellar motor switch phosphatase FliY [Sedimentibacter hydroxybenzoicus DSM 7310]